MAKDKQIKVAKKLTARQYRIFKLVGRGMTSKEIALELNISEKTVQNLRYEICKKLNVRGYGSLYHLALKLRLNGDEH